MKRVLFPTLAALGLALLAPPAVAESDGTATPSRNAGPRNGGEDKDLAGAVAAVDDAGGQPQGRQEVINRLESRFNVDAARIEALRAQNLGFGEIATIFALAGKLQGGITDANIQSILALRNGPPVQGWGEVAHQLGEKLGPVISQVNEVAKEARQAGRSDRVGASQKPDRPDRAQRPDKPDRPDKPERPSKP